MKRIKYSFFFSWSIAFLFITIIGFIPSFLLRPFFRETSLPTYLIIHGILMLLWFAGYFYQNLLVASRRLVNHQKNGVYFFLLAILMSLGNLNVVLNIANEIVNGEMTYHGVVRTYKNSGSFVIGNLFITIFSSLFIILAYLKRQKPNAHKRAIFGASFLLLTPAFDRFVRPFGLPEIFQIIGSFIIPIALLGYEIIRNKKVHPMTILILIVTFLMLPVLMTIINNSSYIEKIVNFLG